MIDRIEKEHTLVYRFLENVARPLAADFNKVVNAGHSKETIDAVRSDCICVWNAAVRHVSGHHGLKAKAGEVSAARKRLRATNSLPFLIRENLARGTAA